MTVRVSYLQRPAATNDTAPITGNNAAGYPWRRVAAHTAGLAVAKSRLTPLPSGEHADHADTPVFEQGRLDPNQHHRLIDRFRAGRGDRADGLLQHRLLRVQPIGSRAKARNDAEIFQVKRQFLVAQLAVLLQQRAAQRYFKG